MLTSLDGKGTATTDDWHLVQLSSAPNRTWVYHDPMCCESVRAYKNEAPMKTRLIVDILPPRYGKRCRFLRRTPATSCTAVKHLVIKRPYAGKNTVDPNGTDVSKHCRNCPHAKSESQGSGPYTNCVQMTTSLLFLPSSSYFWVPIDIAKCQETALSRLCIAKTASNPKKDVRLHKFFSLTL